MEEHYDIIIIGSGAGGGTILHELASTGKRILLLERGNFLPREKENWSTKEVFTNERYKTTEMWRDKDGKEFRPGQHYFVGGNTKLYGATLLRMRQEDFKEVTHVDGVSPEWPLSYDDFEPYYARAEEMYHVHGEAGVDPTEPPRSTPYAYDKLPHEPRIQKLADDLTTQGLKPFPLPMGVRLGDDEPKRRSLTGLDRFDGYPDPSESKADAHVVAVQPALFHENVTLKTDRYVERLVTSDDGKTIQEVVVTHDNNKEIYTAPLVIMSCGAINSAALMLRSKNKVHPEGLGNSSGLVGRNLMLHNNSAFLALSKEPNPTIFGKTLGINDFYYGSDDWEYPLGHIQMLAKSDTEMLRAEVPPVVPGYAVEKMAEHALDFWLTTEDLPQADNRVMLSETGQITLHYTETNRESHRRLKEKLETVLEAIGCETHLIPRGLYFGKKIGIDGVAHQNGTMRFGNDPTSSVLDTNCRVHDIENLYVVDASFFVSSSSVNPTLTIFANALRVADHLKNHVL